MDRAGAPARLHLAAELAEFAGSAAATTVTRLGQTGHGFQLVMTKKEFSLRPAKHTIIFVGSGNATLRAPWGHDYALARGKLAMLRGYSGASVAPAPGETLVMLLVDDE
jgi:hypothetical protein